MPNNPIGRFDSTSAIYGTDMRFFRISDLPASCAEPALLITATAVAVTAADTAFNARSIETHVTFSTPGATTCDLLIWRIEGAALATPVNSGFSTASTGGSLVPGTYFYRVSATTAVGETLASTETSQVVGAGTSTNTVTVNWGAVAGATGYRVYGRTTGAELFIAAVSGSTLTFVDTGAITPAGALPAANTSNLALLSTTLGVKHGTGPIYSGGYEGDDFQGKLIRVRVENIVGGGTVSVEVIRTS